MLSSGTASGRATAGTTRAVPDSSTNHSNADRIVVNSYNIDRVMGLDLIMHAFATSLNESMCRYYVIVYYMVCVPSYVVHVPISVGEPVILSRNIILTLNQHISNVQNQSQIDYLISKLPKKQFSDNIVTSWNLNMNAFCFQTQDPTSIRKVWFTTTGTMGKLTVINYTILIVFIV